MELNILFKRKLILFNSHVHFIIFLYRYQLRLVIKSN